jgi:peptidoglycan LD-endopeptidase CwlK
MTVHPALEEKIRQIDAAAPEINLQIPQALRTYQSQDALYAQGRTTPGKIVTDVRGGFSWHNFGLAVDVVPEEAIAGQPDWNTAHPVWARLISIGEGLGLVSGSTWRTFPDFPHFQLTGKFPVDPDADVRNLFASGGVSAVWAAAFPA